ncbi:hypothetical protein ABK040_014445 [Willaertia magna]
MSKTDSDNTSIQSVEKEYPITDEEETLLKEYYILMSDNSNKQNLEIKSDDYNKLFSTLHLNYYSQIKKNPNFLKLIFSNINFYSLLYLKRFTNLFQNDCQLVYLDLSGNIIGNNINGMKLIKNLLINNSTIQFLNLSLNDIGNDSLMEVLPIFYNLNYNDNNSVKEELNITLKHLDISVNRIGDEGIKNIFEMIKNNNTLESISLRSNKVKKVDTLLEILALVEGKKHPSLTQIFI